VLFGVESSFWMCSVGLVIVHLMHLRYLSLSPDEHLAKGNAPHYHTKGNVPCHRFAKLS
jgi:hypothetical protein